MAINVTLTELSGKAKVLYGEVEGPIKSLLIREDEAWMHSEQAVMDKIFKKVPSTHRVEGYAALSAMDEWLPVGENGEHPGNSMEQTYLKYIPNETWKSEFAISREIIDDNLLMELKNRPQQFIDAYHRSRQNFLAKMLLAPMLGQDKVKIGNFSFDATCADGKKLFDTHKLQLAKGTQTNAFSDDFSADALIKAITVMQNFTDEKGNPLNIDADTIIIPNDAMLKKEVIGVLEAVRDTSVAGGNKGNGLIAGKYRVICSNLFNAAIGAKVPWMLLDSEYNKRRDCLIEQDRVGMEVNSHVASNDALVFSGYARFGAGFVDYRSCACGGLSFGSAL